MMGENTFLWSCVWQGMVCVGVGLVGSFILRRRPARAHQMLLLAMIAAVIVPVMSAVVKHFEWGMFVAEPVVSEPVVESRFEISNYEMADIAAVESAEPTMSVFEEAAGPVVIARPEKTKLRLGTLAIWGWAAASLILYARLLVTFALGIRLLGRSAPAKCERIQKAANAAVVKFGIDKPVVVCGSSKVRGPVIWCWGKRPVLLVPSSGGETNGSLDWVSIVCHELAHWKRRDHISGLLAELVVCIMPWNPLLWLGKRRLVRLSEQACDDWVVAAGQSGTDYAESLLDLAPQGQMVFAPAVLSSKKGLGARVRRILQDKCGNPRTGARWALVVSVVAACMAVGVAFAQARPAKVRPTTKPTAQPISGSKLMDDRNIFEGVMPVIKLAVEGKVGEQRPRIPRLHSEPGPGVLQGIIKDSADTSGHRTALFFVPVEEWPGKPFFWYLANVNESFEITGIPPGTYYLFTVETSNPRNIESIGLPVGWPKPVKITADGKPAYVEIEISTFLSKKARWFWNVQGFLDGVGHLNAENIATEKLGPYGRVTDAKGRPVPYAHVQVREFKPSGTEWGSIKSPDARANAEGYYGLRPLDYRYFVGAMVNEHLKDAAGWRWQYLRRNKVFEGKQGVDFQFGPWLPEKTVGGRIEGTVVDANGNPIPSFYVDIRPDKPWVHVDRVNEPWYKRWGIRAAFSEGKFALGNVPTGKCNLKIRSHQSSSRGGARLGERQITVVGGQTAHLEFEVKDWEKKRGHRPVMRLGRPGPSVCRPGPTKAAEPLSELKVGDKAPLFEVKTVDNKTWKLAEHQGKVVLLCFWVAGSQPSEIRLPAINSVYQSFGGDKRFVMLGLVRRKRKVEDLKQYLSSHDLRWGQAVINGEDKSDLASKYGVQRWPSMILIGPDGKVIARNLKGKAIKWAVEKALGNTAKFGP